MGLKEVLDRNLELRDACQRPGDGTVEVGDDLLIPKAVLSAHDHKEEAQALSAHHGHHLQVDTVGEAIQTGAEEGAAAVGTGMRLDRNHSPHENNPNGSPSLCHGGRWTPNYMAVHLERIGRVLLPTRRKGNSA